jgi:hypothetical protein
MPYPELDSLGRWSQIPNRRTPRLPLPDSLQPSESAEVPPAEPRFTPETTEEVEHLARMNLLRVELQRLLE